MGIATLTGIGCGIATGVAAQPDSLVFHALDDVGSGFVAGVIRGIGDITEANTSTRYYVDDSGVWQSFGSGVVGKTYAGGKWWVVGQKACTNQLTYSRDLTNAAWPESGTAVAAYNAVGLTGVANTASTLTDDNGAAYEKVREILTIANDSNTHVLRVFVKKDTDETRFPEFHIDYTGGTTKQSYVQLNTKTGALNQRIGVGTSSYEANDTGSWWELLIDLTNDSTGNTTLTVDIFPSYGTTLGGGTSGATGSIIVGNVELHRNTTIAEVRGSSPIFTSGATGTINSSDLSFDDANHSDLQGGWYCELRNAGINEVSGTGQAGLIGVGSAGRFLYIGTSLAAYDGSNVASLSGAYTADDTEYKLGVAYGSGSHRVAADGSWGTAVTYAGSYTNTLGKIGIFRSVNFSSTQPCTVLIRDIRRYNLSYAAAQVKIAALMA